MIFSIFSCQLDGNVIVVIGGDDNYRNEEEEERAVVSRWARMKVRSQLKEEFLDGRRSFIFSWDRKHREIHEQALKHYFDQNKKGKKLQQVPETQNSGITHDNTLCGGSANNEMKLTGKY